MKRMTLLLAFAVLLFSLSANLMAQANSCQAIMDTTGKTQPPLGWIKCGGDGNLAYCTVWKWDPPCAPVVAAQETTPGPKCPKCTAGGPINLANGNVYIEDGDVSIPGLGGGLVLGRTWNGIVPSTQTIYSRGIFGVQWRSTYEERTFVGDDNYLKYMRADGSFWSFGYDPTSGSYLTAAPSNDASKLTVTDTTWTITFQNGEKRIFSATLHRLMSIVDRNGNTTTLDYDGSGRLTTVTDPTGRHLYLTYGTSGDALYLVQTVTSGAIGISLSYTYDASNRLTQVTKPDGTTITYTYNSQNLITSVSDSTGVIESHTYDSLGRGLTSSRANGVQAVTVTYP